MTSTEWIIEIFNSGGACEKTAANPFKLAGITVVEQFHVITGQYGITDVDNLPAGTTLK